MRVYIYANTFQANDSAKLYLASPPPQRRRPSAAPAGDLSGAVALGEPGPFLTYKLGGANAPQSPLVPPHEITFCPPRKSPFFLNLYKQTSED